MKFTTKQLLFIIVFPFVYLILNFATLLVAIAGLGRIDGPEVGPIREMMGNVGGHMINIFVPPIFHADIGGVYWLYSFLIGFVYGIVILFIYKFFKHRKGSLS